MNMRDSCGSHLTYVRNAKFGSPLDFRGWENRVDNRYWDNISFLALIQKEKENST